MQYALITLVPTTLNLYNLTQQAFVETDVPIDTIVDLIIYNGTDPYVPPTNTQLVEVADDATIGSLYVSN